MKDYRELLVWQKSMQLVKNDYIRFLYIARGSLNETETQLEICIMLNYFNRDQAKNVFGLCKETGRLMNALISKLQYAGKE